VVAGGRRFSFSVSLVAGDKKGRVGVGIGKAGDTALAIDKALRNAKKNMVRLPLTKTSSIPHEVEAKFSSGIVRITPAKGRGMVAGSSVRSVLELAGVKDVVAKLNSGSKNHLNQAKATIKALGMIRSKR
jgi:small subunit ribosomal protein S5